MNTLRKRVSALLAAIVLASSCMTGAIMNVQADSVSSSESSATSPVANYDRTSIYDDLQDIDIELYPKLANGAPQVIRFSEYCYSENELFKEYYGLYFYVYNPSETPIYDYGNVANMAIAYNADGTVKEYANERLTILDKTENNRFFKFKVENSAKLFPMASEYAAANEGKRRYDIAGIQLRHTNGAYKMDCTFGKTYYFEGYSKGCGSSTTSESTLKSTSDSLETIELKVHHTNYRTGVYKDYVCDELNTVYFSIPNEVFEKYGNKLQKIKADWYEYKTNPVFVTNNEDAYSALEPYIGVDIGGNRYDDLPWRVMWERTGDIMLQVVNYHWAKTFNGLTDGETGYNDIGGNKYYWGGADYITRLIGFLSVKIRTT